MDASTVDEAGLVSYVTLPPDATPEQTREFNLRKAKGGEINILSDAAKFLQDALSNEKYKNTDGTINAEAVNADNAMAGGILNMVERSNEYNKQLGTDIAKGVYVTKMGGQVSLANVVRKEDLVFIDKNKPLSVRQIIYLNRFGKAAPDTKTEKIDFTGENIQEKNAETARQNIYLDAAIQREGQANALKIAKLPYEQIKLTSGGQPLSTMEYDPLASIVAASGGLNKVLDPAKLSKAQIAAINPSWIDAEGQLTAEAMAAKISVGVVGKGEDGGYDYGVFILDNKTLKAKTSLNQSNLLSNGASWITTNAKETKGQDVYKYNPELLRKSLGIKSAPAKGEVDEYGVPVIK